MSCEGWKEVKLGDVIQFNPKLSLKKGTLYKKVTMQDLIPFERKISGWSKEKFTGGARFENGDTLLARITPCLENGKTAFVDILEQGEIGFGSTEFIVMRPKENITNEKFVYYLAISPNFRSVAIQLMTGSSGRQRVQLDLLKDTLFPIPPLEEQKEIVRILSSIDDKIELNHQMNQDLEDMAQAIFKSWFINFEPFRDGEFVDSELGPIPKGWEVKKLGEVLSLIIDHRGKTPKKLGGNWSDSGIPALSAKNIKSNRIVNFNDVKYISNELYLKWMKEELDSYDILLTSEGPLGELYFLYEKEKFCLSQRLFGLRANIKIVHPIFLYLQLASSRTQSELQSKSTGSTVAGIRQKELRKVRIIVPPVDIQEKVSKLLEPIFAKVYLNQKEIVELISLRDTLLPKLISGEIRV